MVLPIKMVLHKNMIYFCLHTAVAFNNFANLVILLSKEFDANILKSFLLHCARYFHFAISK